MGRPRIDLVRTSYRTSCNRTVSDQKHEILARMTLRSRVPWGLVEGSRPWTFHSSSFSYALGLVPCYAVLLCKHDLWLLSSTIMNWPQLPKVILRSGVSSSLQTPSVNHEFQRELAQELCTWAPSKSDLEKRSSIGIRQTVYFITALPSYDLWFFWIRRCTGRSRNVEYPAFHQYNWIRS